MLPSALVYDRSVRLAAVVAGTALAAGCLRAADYPCTSDSQCAAAGAPGTCEPTADGRHFCAVPDDTCASHRRFGDSAGDQSDACAGGALPEGRSADVCLAGARVPIASSSCAAAVCAKLPTCCAASWGPLCVEEAELACAMPCGRQLALVGGSAIDVLADDAGTGAFSVVTTAGDAGQHYADVQWADLDGDDVPELVVSTADLDNQGDEQSIDHYDGTSITTAFDVRTALDAQGETPFEHSSFLAISVGDFDGDGWADSAWIGTYPTFETLHNRRELSFEVGPAGTTGPPDLVNPIGGGIGLGDVDGDGVDELAVIVDNTLYVLEAGPDHFTATASIPLPGEPFWGAWGDLDGDGKLDLAVAGRGYATVFRNTGTALSSTAAWSIAGLQFYGGAWIDVDGDGDLDLAVTEYDGRLHVYRNDNGTLGTTPEWSSLEDQEAPRVLAADVDGDGDLDLVVANHLPYPPRLYLNHEHDGTFELGTLTAPAQAYESVSSCARTAPTR